MSYSSENCMVSEETAKKIRIKEFMTKERLEKLKAAFEKSLKALREANREAKG